MVACTDRDPFTGFVMRWNAFLIAATAILCASCSKAPAKPAAATPAAPSAAAQAPTIVSGDNGTLEVGGVGARMVVASDAAKRTLEGHGGRWSLAPGTYHVEALALTRLDAEGLPWTIFGRKGIGQPITFEVRPGQVTQLKLGPPISVGADVTVKDGEMKVSLVLAGVGGEYYAAAAIKDLNLRKAPDFRISDESGKELDSGKCNYG